MSHLLPLTSASPIAASHRDASRTVVLVGFQEQANLGLGYLASVLRQAGYRVCVFDFEQEPRAILEAVRECDPLLVGFSLIFQFYVQRFRTLARYLRGHGISCHFTMGGHFPSLSYRTTLEMVPEIDSVVRFEGEMTLLELVERLGTGREWQTVQGIAYRDGGAVVATALRPLIHDLDELPYPDRSAGHRTAVLGHTAVPLLASRGCARTCSFCSIHMFYRGVPGKVVRTRRPAAVVEEMRALHETQNATIFLFQDDDFPLFGPVWRRWASEFVGELHRQGLPGRVIWKINCRADAVDPGLFETMREAGLYLVYMGLESGTEEGLQTLHKQITVDQNLRAVAILKELGLLFEFGFMLFDPSSTFDSVRQNVGFLRQIVGDGSAAAVFCRMIPYDGTPIKDTLARQGRLRGDVENPEYDFLDPLLADYYVALRRIVDVTGWIHGHAALSPAINFAWNELAVLERLFPALPDTDAYRRVLREVTRVSNDLLFHVVEDLADVYPESRPNTWDPEALRREAAGFLAELVRERDRFLARHQTVLLAALRAPATPAGVPSA